MTPVQLLLIFIVIGLSTYAIRLSFLVLSGRLELPEAIKAGLQFIPAAVLTALIIPALARHDGRAATDLAQPAPDCRPVRDRRGL